MMIVRLQVCAMSEFMVTISIIVFKINSIENILCLVSNLKKEDNDNIT